MAYVVTAACIGTKDRSCVEVCPVDCFYNNPDPELNKRFGKDALKAGDVVSGVVVDGGSSGNGTSGNGSSGDGDSGDESSKKDWGMLVINPDECIHCGACETECPVEAIYEDTGVPDDLKEFVQLNEKAVSALSADELDARRVLSKK